MLALIFIISLLSLGTYLSKHGLSIELYLDFKPGLYLSSMRYFKIFLLSVSTCIKCEKRKKDMNRMILNSSASHRLDSCWC